MARTLSQILTDITAVLDLEASLPVGDELATRSNYANQVVWDVSAIGQLSEFKREHLTSASTLATISLPSNFKEMQENPRLYISGGWVEWPVIEVEQKYDMSTGARYCYVLGNPAEGYNLIFNSIEVADQLSIIYQRYPSGLTTLSSVCELSDPQVIVRKVEAYVLYSRSDDRFQIADQKAEQQIANLMAREMKGSSGQGRSTKMTFKNPLGRS